MVVRHYHHYSSPHDAAVLLSCLTGPIRSQSVAQSSQPMGAQVRNRAADRRSRRCRAIANFPPSRPARSNPTPPTCPTFGVHSILGAILRPCLRGSDISRTGCAGGWAARHGVYLPNSSQRLRCWTARLQVREEYLAEMNTSGQIWTYGGSQQGGFEELCSQLAECESVPAGSTFVRKAPPDAGALCAARAQTMLICDRCQDPAEVVVATMEIPALDKTYTLCGGCTRELPRGFRVV